MLPYWRVHLADPKLTTLGEEQARIVNQEWKNELSFGLSVPASRYCSPLTRATRTCLLTFDGLPTSAEHPVVIVEVWFKFQVHHAYTKFCVRIAARNTGNTLATNATRSRGSPHIFPILSLKRASLKRMKSGLQTKGKHTRMLLAAQRLPLIWYSTATIMTVSLLIVDAYSWFSISLSSHIYYCSWGNN